MWLAVFATLPLGCQSGPPQRVYDTAAVQRESYTAGHPAMVVGGPAATTASASEVTPWWFTRNDGELNIREDGAAWRHEAIRIDVRDRQYSTPGRVRDTYRRTVRSTTWGHMRR